MYLDVVNQQEMTFDSMIFEVFIIMAIVKVNNKGSHSKNNSRRHLFLDPLYDTTPFLIPKVYQTV